MTGCAQSEEGESGERIRIGTFDSRAVAVAYGRSDAFNSQVADLMTEYEKAKTSGDEKRIKELEAEGPAKQELMEKQVFSTWPVNNILEQIEETIPEIANRADVDVIVCKWDIVYQGSGVEFVDVTDLMVSHFDPDDETLKIIEDLKEADPVPMDELKHH
jgi:hypothetical protein